jgi:glycosyltransferase involved in cell wall biosynthesis
LRIAIDGSELSGSPTGVGRYLAVLLRQWMAQAGGSDEEVFVVYVRDDPALDLPDDPRLDIRRLNDGAIKSPVYWQQVVLARELRAAQPDVLFAPADAAPLRYRGPKLATVHDLSYFAHPEWFDFKQGARRRWLTRKSVASVDRIVAVSEFTKAELVRRLAVPEDKIRVVPHGRDPRLDDVAPTPEAFLRRQLGQDGPFALVVGSMFERRHTTAVLDAFARLEDLGVGLVFAGADRRREGGDLHKEIRSRGLEARVSWADYCTEADLVGLYRIADHLIYVSDYEGFGLPPLEGMGFGLPAIVAGCAALHEVYGDSVHPVAMLNAESIAESVRALLSSPDLRDTLVARGRQLAETLDARICAERTLAELRALGTPA